MTTLYFICFVLGLVLTVLSALRSLTRMQLGPPRRRNRRRESSAESKSGVSPVNGFTLAAFLCWFGGCGYLLTRGVDFAPPTVLVLSVLTGLAGSAILYWLLVRVLLPWEEEPLEETDDILGIFGLVTAPIDQDGLGEIHFSQRGSHRFVPARSDGGASLPRGTEVIVIRYEEGIAFVRPWDQLSSGKRQPRRSDAAGPPPPWQPS